LAALLEDRSGTRDIAMAAVVGQDAVMADADQASGQDVPTEAADELDGAQGQGFDFGAVAVC
jgi:pyruvate kinase